MRRLAWLWMIALAACSGGDGDPTPATDAADAAMSDAADVDATDLDASVIDATDLDAAVIDAPAIDAPLDAAIDAGFPPPVVIAADSPVLFEPGGYNAAEPPVIVYIDVGGVVHVVRRRAGAWTHTDVSAAAGLPPAAEQVWSFAGSSVAAAQSEDLGLLVRLSDGLFRRVTHTTAGAWSAFNLTGASGHVRATRWAAGLTHLIDTEHILYTGTDGVFYDLFRDDASTSPTFAARIIIAAPPPSGPITTGQRMDAMFADGTGRPIVLRAEPLRVEAPLTGAMVGQGLVTNHEATIPFADIVWRDAAGGLHAATRTNTGHRDLTAQLALSTAASDLRGSILPLPAPVATVTYRDTAGHVIVVRGMGSACFTCMESWSTTDLTASTGAPLAAGVVLVDQSGRMVVYFGVDGHLHLVERATARGPWMHTDVTAALP